MANTKTSPRRRRPTAPAKRPPRARPPKTVNRKAAREEAEVEIRDLSYEYASDLAEAIPDYQRRVRARHVARLADDMTTGRWQLSPDASVVRLDDNGDPLELINGQHRIQARLVAGPELDTGLPVLVLERSGITADEAVDTYLATDTGLARTFGDYLGMRGVPNYFNAAAVALMVCTVNESPGGHYAGQAASISHSQLADWWEACDQPLLNEAVKVGLKARKGAFLPSSAVSAIVYISAQEMGSADQAIEFFELVAKGGGADDAPAQKLRSRFAQYHGASERVKRHVAWNLILRAWHAYLAGEPLGKLMWTADRSSPLTVTPVWAIDNDNDNINDADVDVDGGAVAA